MPSAAIRSRARVCVVFAVLTLALAGSAIEETKAQSGEAVTVQDCRNAWNSASARPTCSATPNDILLSAGECRIKKACQYYGINIYGAPQEMSKLNDVTVPLADVDELHNCTGTLTVGAC